jgi:hypothetical protein
MIPNTTKYDPETASTGFSMCVVTEIPLKYKIIPKRNKMKATITVLSCKLTTFR